MLKNLVEETANNPGTGTTVTLAGAPSGRLTWRGSGFANGAQVFYFITDSTIGEWGIGTLTLAASDTLSRDTVLGNTAGTNVKLNFTGACRVYNALPAERSLYVGQSAVALSGDITITKAAPQISLEKTASGQSAVVTGGRLGAIRWSMHLGNATAESGVGNVGSDFSIDRYNDAGTLIGTAFSIARSSGVVTVGTLAVTGAVTAGGTVTAPLVAAADLTVAGSKMWEPGDIKTTARSTPGAGWLLCDGSAVSRTTYAALYAAIGDTFGAGNGTTTFNLPDFRDKFLRGSSAGVGTNGGSTTGTTSSNGSHNHTGAVGGTAITIGQMPSHGHTGYTSLNGAHYHLSGTTGLYAAYGGGTVNTSIRLYTDGPENTISLAPTSTEPNHQHSVDVYPVGNDETHTHSIANDGAHTHTVSTVPPWVGVNYVIKT